MLTTLARSLVLWRVDLIVREMTRAGLSRCRSPKVSASRSLSRGADILLVGPPVLDEHVNPLHVAEPHPDPLVGLPGEARGSRLKESGRV